MRSSDVKVHCDPSDILEFIERLILIKLALGPMKDDFGMLMYEESAEKALASLQTQYNRPCDVVYPRGYPCRVASLSHVRHQH
jgi:hypothetical protein